MKLLIALGTTFNFVDSDKHVREEFLGFITVKRITSEALATALVSWLEAYNLDVSLCGGQGYDGATNMLSSAVGVQAQICEASPLAVYSLPSLSGKWGDRKY